MSTVEEPPVPPSPTDPPVEIPEPTDYDKLQDERLNKLESAVKKLQEGPPPPPPKPAPTKPTETGTPRIGADTNPHNWKVVEMEDRDKKGKWKIIDKKKERVRTDLSSKEVAQQWIDYETYIYDGGNLPPPVDHHCPAGQHWDDVQKKCVDDIVTPPPPGGGGGDKDQFGVTKIFKDKPGGTTVTKADVEHKTRNYRSGQPSEPTVELTIEMPPGHQQDMECTAIVTMPGMNHNDTIDWKLRGPGHSDGSGKNWYCIDQETDGGHKITFKTEKPHPKYFDNSSFTKNYFVVPNISKAKFGWKGIVVNKSPTDVYIACWINMTPDNENGWKKVWDCHDTGQIKNGQITPPTGGNCQVRIDGISGKVQFEKASVREIVYNEADAVKTTTTAGEEIPHITSPIVTEGLSTEEIEEDICN